MSEDQSDAGAPELARVSDSLNSSLRRCANMVRDYRSRLIAANSNEPGFMMAAEAGNDGSSLEDDERTG